jgi:hypothetical protein
MTSPATAKALFAARATMKGYATDALKKVHSHNEGRKHGYRDRHTPRRRSK